MTIAVNPLCSHHFAILYSWKHQRENSREPSWLMPSDVCTLPILFLLYNTWKLPCPLIFTNHWSRKLHHKWDISWSAELSPFCCISLRLNDRLLTKLSICSCWNVDALILSPRSPAIRSYMLDYIFVLESRRTFDAEENLSWNRIAELTSGILCCQ